MHPMETKTASGATNTEDGQTKESESSLPTLGEKVKLSQAMEPIFTAPEREPIHLNPVPLPLDLRTEMFMLNAVKEILGMCYGIGKEDKYGILCDLISKCAEANGI